MGPWRSSFELLVPNRSPSQVADAARLRGGTRTQVGLIVRVRDQLITARYNELSRSSTAPVLKGRLTPEASGTRIVGKIQWTSLIAAPFAMMALGLLCLVLGVSGLSDRSWILGACFVLGAAAFALLGIHALRGRDVTRDQEEERLRSELLAVLTGQ